MNQDYIISGISLFSGDPSVVVPASVSTPCPREGRGWAYVHVKTASHASDTTTVTIKGRLNSGGAFVALKQSDQSTAFSVAQSAGGLTEVISTVQLLPEMLVALSGTSTTGASTKVWLEAKGAATRTNS